MAEDSDMKRELNALKKELASLKGDIGRLSEQGARTAKEGAEGVYDAAKDAVAQARERLAREADALVGKVRAGASDVVGTVKEGGAVALHQVEDTVKERPLTAVVAAVGVGLVAGMLLARR